MGQSLGATLKSMAALSMDPANLKEIQEEYLKQATELWNNALEKPDQLAPKDRRFAAPEWASNPGSAFLASMYLLNARTLQRMADSLKGDEKARERVRFAVQQWVDAASPANFLALNPEVQKKAVETRGESLTQGMQLLLNDLKQGHMSLTDESVFEVGRNVATTEGSVVFENPFFQLIEYKPLTDKVHEVPFLFVPPAINKFYILDLQPDNSLVRYLLSQGHRVFMVSWVNADDSLAKCTWDDYIEDGVIKAINTTREIAGSDKVNALGFCVGGTLLATALATLAGRGEKPAASLTLLTTFLDFTETGTLDIFIDEAMVQMREMTIGTLSPQQGGLMRGNELAATFSFLRANDLVWNYVVGNYLKGETPPAFDLLYWNSDSTNLPGPMYTWYLRNTYLENKLCKPGAVTVCGQPLDMRLLDMPTFVYASREDHIVPWESAYGSTKVLQGPIKFVLGASGHIAGVINPPTKNKRSYWTAEGLPATSAEWFAQSTEHPGSWWPTWAKWLESQAGGMVPAPKSQGSRQYPVIEAAPGRYVKRKS
ncbi:MAG TPA: class I poly(R)-hydroxyalkanoic acid synthase [Aquabacterium sp.]|nr:class I poly(R)-hydroxyalkanoic acid synthase [Aquabacterium sp.]HEX5311540.1 class I poly(R)-hydroxyalkanoic acid synthase [Aquabacterium sp.]